MRITWKHGTNRETAIDVIERLLPRMLERYGGDVPDHSVARENDTWSFAGRVSLFSISGRLRVDETELVLDVDGVPFPFGGKARSEILRWLADNWPRDAKKRKNDAQ